jgi:hypothetical protein
MLSVCIRDVLNNKNMKNHSTKTFGVADFGDENNIAYIQTPCRDVPWNVSTHKKHPAFMQCQTF